jgi:hypothetical protein
MSAAERGKKERKRRDADILSIGNQMSNVMFNLKQRTSMMDHERAMFNELQKQWDVATNNYLQSFKRKGR